MIAYDDSDGWYDHVTSKVLNGSKDTTVGSNGKALDSPACQSGPAAAKGYADRCGPGTRQPLLVVSPYSRVNAIDHTATEQASITRFIEDNWHTGRIGDGSSTSGRAAWPACSTSGTPTTSRCCSTPTARSNRCGGFRTTPGQPRPPSGGKPYAPYVADLKAQDLADTGSTSPALPISLAAGLVTAVATTTVLTVRRRRTRTAAR
ncbi:Phospholipase OS=Streptomyces griseorubiginosus OX=67304 GN=AQJ54_28275 PE=4 SV=1 [Streptomyces griseorubiginosus]